MNTVLIKIILIKTIILQYIIIKLVFRFWYKGRSWPSQLHRHWSLSLTPGHDWRPVDNDDNFDDDDDHFNDDDDNFDDDDDYFDGDDDYFDDDNGFDDRSLITTLSINATMIW